MNATNKLFWMTVVAAAVAQPGLGQEKYDLSRVPKFRVGDRVTYTSTSRSSSSILGKDDKPLQDTREVNSAELVQEVLAVDAAGRITRFRTTVASAISTASSSAPSKAAFKKKIPVRNICGTTVLRDGRYVTDTTTLACASAAKLTASQISLVKRIFLDSLGFRAYDRSSAALMPAEPVAVGASWTPPAGALKNWAEDYGVSRKLRAIVRQCRLILLGVKGDRASVRARMRLAAVIAGEPVAPNIEVLWTIHVPTGRRISEAASLSLSAEVKGRRVVLAARRLSAMAFTAGAGTAGKGPDDYHDIGWPPPGRDTNSFRDAARGVSLDVPEGYKPRLPRRAEVVASFACPADAQLTVSQAELPRPVDFEEILPEFIKNIEKSVKDYKQIRTEPVSLAGNVPARLIVGSAMGGKAAIIRLLALDGRRVVAVLAAAPAARPSLVTELTRIAKSVRVFEPEPESKPSGARR